MKKNKKVIFGILAAIAVVAVAGFMYFRNHIGGVSSGTVAYVDSISNIMGYSGGFTDRFTGVVEAQQSVKINKNQEKKVEERYVSVGDQVTPATPLFKYDVSAAQKAIDAGNLEIESSNNTIIEKNNEIADLQASGGADVQAQISYARNEIRAAELAIQQKRLEIAGHQKEVDNAVVLAGASGTIKAINENSVDAQGNAVAYIEISQSGEFRVKGKVDEKLIQTLTKGQDMIVRSRSDETQVWTGKITEIKTEPNTTQQNGYYGPGGGNAETASTYPFYISLDSSAGLLLGQHVYIEANTGTAMKRDGIWLEASYLILEGDKAYLWVANQNNRLEKREVEIGELDENLHMYEIKSGASVSDRIAWPLEDYKEGMATESFSASGTGE